MANILVVGSSGIDYSLTQMLITEGSNVYGTFNKTAISPEGFTELHPLEV